VAGLKREKIGIMNIATINGARLGYGSGAIALPEPEPEDAQPVVKAPIFPQYPANLKYSTQKIVSWRNSAP
jgi:hypothetical protein